MDLERFPPEALLCLGESQAIRTLRDEIERFARYSRPVLLLGERGTGKEVVARSLHAKSPRRHRPFVAVNSAAFSKGLIGSELFGHERGAFTSADRSRRGRLEEADGGTLFLDEIGRMPLWLQDHLLRVIEYQNFKRLGGEEAVRVDVRIVCATNQDLGRMVREGTFHPDFYDRIRHTVIRLPPLRERREDIPVLAERFLREFLEEHRQASPARFTNDAMAELVRREWPGNIRELKAVVENAAMRTEGEEIRASDLPADDSFDAEIPGGAAEGPAPSAPSDRPVGLKEQVRAFERSLVAAALRNSPNRRAAAKRLGVTYDQLRWLVKKYGL